MMINFYDVLSVEEDSTTAQIKRAYTQLALKYHPDKNPGASAEDAERLKATFVSITEAYNVLTDDKSRQLHNRRLEQEREEVRNNHKREREEAEKNEYTSGTGSNNNTSGRKKQAQKVDLSFRVHVYHAPEFLHPEFDLLTSAELIRKQKVAFVTSQLLDEANLHVAPDNSLLHTLRTFHSDFVKYNFRESPLGGSIETDAVILVGSMGQRKAQIPLALSALSTKTSFTPLADIYQQICAFRSANTKDCGILALFIFDCCRVSSPPAASMPDTSDSGLK